MCNRVLACAMGLSLAGAADAAALFSFASDVDSGSFTFVGGAGGVIDAQDPTDGQILFIDDTNGVLPTLSLGVEFEAAFVMSYVASVPVTADTFVHTYALAGAFGFFDAAGAPILTAQLVGGAMTALGSANAWGSSETIQVNDIGASEIVYTWWGPDLPSYGIYTGQSVGPDDAAFTLTFTLSPGAIGVPLGTDGLPTAVWTSEGSYSGSAYFIPTPGALALGGLGLFASLRRRR